MTTEMESLKGRLKATWMAGDSIELCDTLQTETV